MYKPLRNDLWIFLCQKIDAECVKWALLCVVFSFFCHFPIWCSGPEVIKREFILRLKIKYYDWLLADKQPIIALYFEFENELKFYNLEAWIRYGICI